MPENLDKAAMWLSKAAAQGEPEAQYKLSLMHRQGCLMVALNHVP